MILKSLKKWTFRILGSLATFLTVTVLITGIYLHNERITLTDQEIETLLLSQGYKPTIHYEKSGGFMLRYLEVGQADKPITVMVHGAPSSLMGFKHFFAKKALLQKTRFLVFDRPGYGYSNFGQTGITIRQQANAIGNIIGKFSKRNKPVTLIGSSYGGPVCAAVAMFFPNTIKNLVLVSASVAPGEERIYPISYPASWPIVRSLIPKVLNVANTEKLTHEQNLQTLLPYWKNIVCPTTIIHGKTDDLIYFSNALFAEKMLVNAPIKLVFIPGQGHYIPWQRPNVVEKAILDCLPG